MDSAGLILGFLFAAFFLMIDFRLFKSDKGLSHFLYYIHTLNF